MIVPIFLTDPYIVVIADRGRGEREGETLSWSEGEERERGRQVWGEGNKTQKSVEGGSVAEKHATLAFISCCFGLHCRRTNQLGPAGFTKFFVNF